jgi:hypothetical protein
LATSLRWILTQSCQLLSGDFTQCDEKYFPHDE